MTLMTKLSTTAVIDMDTWTSILHDVSRSSKSQAWVRRREYWSRDGTTNNGDVSSRIASLFDTIAVYRMTMTDSLSFPGLSIKIRRIWGRAKSSRVGLDVADSNQSCSSSWLEMISWSLKFHLDRIETFCRLLSEKRGKDEHAGDDRIDILFVADDESKSCSKKMGLISTDSRDVVVSDMIHRQDPEKILVIFWRSVFTRI